MWDPSSVGAEQGMQADHADPVAKPPLSSSPKKGSSRRVFSSEGETHPKNSPTQIKAQFAQTISGQFVQTVPPFSLYNKQKTGRKSSRKLFVQTVFIWVGGFLGGSPSLEFSRQKVLQKDDLM